MSVVTTLNLVRSCFPTDRVREASTQSYVNRCTLRSLLLLLKAWLTGTRRDPLKVGVASKISANVDSVPISLSQRLATMHHGYEIINIWRSRMLYWAIMCSII